MSTLKIFVWSTKNSKWVDNSILRYYNSFGDLMLKTEILNIIACNAPEYVSGQVLAQRLNVSRNAVWKAINELKNDGYTIESSAKKGYRLSALNEKISAAEILRHTSFIKPVVFDALESTNDTARLLAQQNAAQGTTVIANSQTKGKGRMGREFFSPEGGIYMSIVLKPQTNIENILFLTVAAAVAAAESIENASGKKSEIKWVNDVYIEGKKVCGILTEGAICAETAQLEYAVLGVGINTVFCASAFPKQLQTKAGGVFSSRATSGQKACLIADFCNRFFEMYQNLDSRDFVSKYQSRSFLDGKTVEYYKNGEKQTAQVLKIDSEARLVVKNGQSTEILSSGDVQLEGFYE